MRHILSAVILALAAGCGGSSSPTTPTPTPTPQPQNQAPIITSATIAPTFGIAYLTVFVYSALAHDPDGDPITYKWEFADNTSQDGQSFSRTYGGSGETNARIVVTDSRGGKSEAYTNVVVVGSMTGTWHGNSPGLGNFEFRLTQDRSFITGTFHYQGLTGRTDPAGPGTIDAQGNISMRIKTSGFADFFLTGRMDTTGRRVAGTLKGTAADGAFEMTK